MSTHLKERRHDAALPGCVTQDDDELQSKDNDITWLVVDEFIYNGTTYRYIVEDAEEGTVNSLHDIKNLSMGFIKHMGNNEYAEVVDIDEINAVNQIVVERLYQGSQS